MQSAEELAKAILNETGGYIEPWINRSIPIIRARDREIVRLLKPYIKHQTDCGCYKFPCTCGLDPILRDLG